MGYCAEPVQSLQCEGLLSHKCYLHVCVLSAKKFASANATVLILIITAPDVCLANMERSNFSCVGLTVD